MTPNTTRAPAAAPSTASDKAKQLASFSNRISRPNRCERSRSDGPAEHERRNGHLLPGIESEFRELVQRNIPGCVRNRATGA
jgi:hypothetical protein